MPRVYPHIKTMKIAILADIHGNLPALQAVLADIDQQNPDEILCGGDVITKGPHPAECLAIVRGREIRTIIGNTDVRALNKDGEMETWNYERLSAEDIAFLQALPLMIRITPPNGRSPEDDLLLVHSTPRDCNDVLILEPHPIKQEGVFGTATAEAEAIKMLAGERANLIVYGHIHYVSHGTVSGQRIASIGTVGLPFDGDARAGYSLVEWNGVDWHLEHRRVAYDRQPVIQALLDSDMPKKERFVKMLETSLWAPF